MTTEAIALLRETVRKAEGSRGGHVIGHAASGRAQYASHGPVIGKTRGGQHVFRDAPANHPLYAKMTGRDHLDAHKIHTDHDGDKQAHGLSHWAAARAKKDG